MQIKCLHKNIYKLYSYARTQEILDKYRRLYEESVTAWETLKNEGAGDGVCRQFSGISRSTYYRRKKILLNLQRGISPPSKRPKRLNKPRWGESGKQLVLRIRRENPTYGKAKIAVILKRDHGVKFSESSVGRILQRLAERGLVTKSPSASRTKRRRCFKNHAKPWNYKDYKKMEMGERVQVDHMTITRNGVSAKHFQSWDRKSKAIHAQIYSKATAKSAKKFLQEMVEKSPFKILSIQVDGGSEFMAEFEETCGNFGIPLMVLPPASPKYNGGVERGNRIFREEFYNSASLLANNISEMRPELEKALMKYNNYRPHQALNGMTPMEYINNNSTRPSNQSQTI